MLKKTEVVLQEAALKCNNDKDLLVATRSEDNELARYIHLENVPNVSTKGISKHKTPIINRENRISLPIIRETVPKTNKRKVMKCGNPIENAPTEMKFTPHPLNKSSNKQKVLPSLNRRPSLITSHNGRNHTLRGYTNTVCPFVPAQPPKLKSITTHADKRNLVKNKEPLKSLIKTGSKLSTKTVERNHRMKRHGVLPPVIKSETLQAHYRNKGRSRKMNNDGIEDRDTSDKKPLALYIDIPDASADDDKDMHLIARYNNKVYKFDDKDVNLIARYNNKVYNFDEHIYESIKTQTNNEETPVPSSSNIYCVNTKYDGKRNKGQGRPSFKNDATVEDKFLSKGDKKTITWDSELEDYYERNLRIEREESVQERLMRPEQLEYIIDRCMATGKADKSNTKTGKHVNKYNQRKIARDSNFVKGKSKPVRRLKLPALYTKGRKGDKNDKRQ